MTTQAPAYPKTCPSCGAPTHLACPQSNEGDAWYCACEKCTWITWFSPLRALEHTRQPTPKPKRKYRRDMVLPLNSPRGKYLNFIKAGAPRNIETQAVHSAEFNDLVVNSYQNNPDYNEFEIEHILVNKSESTVEYLPTASACKMLGARAFLSGAFPRIRLLPIRLDIGDKLIMTVRNISGAAQMFSGYLRWVRREIIGRRADQP